MISISFNSFYIRGLFRGGVAYVIRILNSRSCCYMKRKNNPLDILVHYEQLSVPSSIRRSTKQTQKNDVAIHRYSLNPRDRSGRERSNLPSPQFRFLQHGSFCKPKYLDLRGCLSYFHPVNFASKIILPETLLTERL